MGPTPANGTPAKGLRVRACSTGACHPTSASTPLMGTATSITTSAYSTWWLPSTMSRPCSGSVRTSAAASWGTMRGRDRKSAACSGIDERPWPPVRYTRSRGTGLPLPRSSRGQNRNFRHRHWLNVLTGATPTPLPLGVASPRPARGRAGSPFTARPGQFHWGRPPNKSPRPIPGGRGDGGVPPLTLG